MPEGIARRSRSLDVRWLVIPALAAWTLALHWTLRGHPFLYAFDDPTYITANPRVLEGLSWRGVVWAFTQIDATAGNWHPLTWLSHMADVQLFGLDAGAHHLESAVLHALNAVVLFLVLARMTGAAGRSAVVAFLFAVHPLHVESVAWAAERKEVLSALFGFLALGAWRLYAERPSIGRYVAVAALFALSVLAKPMWVTFPFLVLLLDYWPLRRIAGFRPGADGSAPPVAAVPLRRVLLEKLPLLAISAASSAATLHAQQAAFSEYPLPIRLGNTALAYARYLGKTLWPASLSVFYPRDPVLPVGAAVAAAVLLLAVTMLAVRSAKAQPWLVVGWLWFLGTLVPVIGLVQVGDQAMADRYMYLPIVGLLVAATWWGHRIAGGWLRGIPLQVGAVLLVLVLSGATWRQLDHWSTHEALFRHAIAVTGDNATAQALLAAGLRREGRSAEALGHAQEAVRLEPDNARMWIILGGCERDLRRLPNALEAFRRAVRIDAEDLVAWSTLAELSTQLGNYAEAEAAYGTAARLAPDDARVWVGLGALHATMGKRAEAVQDLREALRLEPGDGRAAMMLRWLESSP
jgi:cytochrome c-type biogenesis protein CcmH/NrfG